MNEKNGGNTPSPVLRKEEDYRPRLLPSGLKCSVGVGCKVACMLMNPFRVCPLERGKKQSCKRSEGSIPTGLSKSSWAAIWPFPGRQMIMIGRHRRHFLFCKFRFPYRHCHFMPLRISQSRTRISLLANKLWQKAKANSRGMFGLARGGDAKWIEMEICFCISCPSFRVTSVLRSSFVVIIHPYWSWVSKYSKTLEMQCLWEAELLYRQQPHLENKEIIKGPPAGLMGVLELNSCFQTYHSHLSQPFSGNIYWLTHGIETLSN